MRQPTTPNATSTGKPLPTIATPLSGVEVVARLDGASRRGRLPGFHKGAGEVLFTITDFGTPCESVLVANAVPALAGGVAGSEIRFQLHIKRTLPTIVAILFVLSIWPGVWLTHSMLGTYINGYSEWPVKTWMWYIPLTVASIPPGWWQMIRKSRRTAHAEALNLIRKVESIAGSGTESGSITPPAATSTAA